MRIGLFSDTYPPYINGVSTSVNMLKIALEKLGHEVFVITVNDKLLDYSFEEDDHVIRVPGIKTGIYDYRLTSAYPLKIIKKIKSMNLDIVHVHTEFSIGSFGRIIAKQFNIPIVATYHTYYEDYLYYINKGFFDKTPAGLVANKTTCKAADSSLADIASFLSSPVAFVGGAIAGSIIGSIVGALLEPVLDSVMNGMKEGLTTGNENGEQIGNMITAGAGAQAAASSQSIGLRPQNIDEAVKTVSYMDKKNAEQEHDPEA